MELRHLRYFVAVASEQSFTRAAEKLHIAQPPLSRQIQQLEEEFGLVLIDRDSRPLRLTDAGRLMHEQAVQVLERVDEIRAMAKRLRAAGRDRFAIGFVTSTLYGGLPEVIRRYRAARPEVELTLLEMTTIEQVAALKEGRIDVGFGRIALDDPTVDQRLLRNEALVVALPTGHPLATHEDPLCLDDLAGEGLVVFPKAPRPSFADMVLSLYRERGLRPGAVHEVRELQTALGLVVAGEGISLVPASAQRLRRDDIVYRPLHGDKAVAPVIMSHRAQDGSPEIGVLLDLIYDMYQAYGIPHEPRR
ncbi:LysR family transcriptional regulator [Azospirillum brasilense]|uniref:LysR family transcriptional regulator n=1 Tax=Azospirillum brasilense TaxID=192 RepID=UPI001EDADAB9|nr:LysR family transcriptional regulator [Azospirillum brasilense]UKJ75087.1 LysR family transcriptional regulator [Azospirillum brasilense]